MIFFVETLKLDSRFQQLDSPFSSPRRWLNIEMRGLEVINKPLSCFFGVLVVIRNKQTR